VVDDFLDLTSEAVVARGRFDNRQTKTGWMILQIQVEQGRRGGRRC
jgi:hypothetical protein